LADLTHDALLKHCVLTPEYPTEWYDFWEAREGTWERRGDPVVVVIGEMAGLDERVASDLTVLLSGHHSYSEVKGGMEDPYGIEAMYEERCPDDSEFRFTWEEFRREVRSRSRFFTARAEEMLRYIFGDLNSLEAISDVPVVREINPGCRDAFVWRARTAFSDDELRRILGSPSDQLNAPPSSAAKSGRMNAQGISVFYGAMDRDTCVAEVRAPVGAHVVVGRFEVVRPVRLLDLDRLSNAYAGGSCFEPSLPERQGRAAFFRHLVREISGPVMPQDEALEYIATQTVAEYLAHKVIPRIDGVIFQSPQTGGEGRNVVLFNHARGVELYLLPEGTNVEVLIPRFGMSDPDNEYDDNILVSETVPSIQSEENQSADGVRPSHVPVRLFKDSETESFQGDFEPTLRLDLETLNVLVIRGVTYEFNCLSISRLKRTEEERNAFDEGLSDF